MVVALDLSFYRMNPDVCRASLGKCGPIKCDARNEPPLPYKNGAMRRNHRSLTIMVKRMPLGEAYDPLDRAERAVPRWSLSLKLDHHSVDLAAAARVAL